MDFLLDQAPCGFVAFTDDGIVREANATLRLLLGYGAGEIEGKHFSTFLSAGGRVFYQTHLFPTLKLQGKADEVYLSLRTRGGAEVPVLLNGVRRAAPNGELPARFDCVLVPMRQRSRFEDEILRAKRAAEEATEAKQAAFADLQKAHARLEIQQEELRAQQEHLLELNTRLRERADRETLLNYVGQALRTSENPDETLALTVGALGRALRVDRCYFVEYDRDHGMSRIRADWHRPGLRSLRGTYALGDYGLTLAEVYGPDGMWQSADLEAPSGANGSKSSAARKQFGIRAGVAAAYLEGGFPAAALSIAMTESPRVWTAEEVETVQSVVTLIRSVLEEARLRDRERRIASVLQDALQPPLAAAIPGLLVEAFYRPALDEAAVGGDFYDVFPVADRCHALVVADLSGKGLAAASQVATVRHMLRTLLFAQPDRTLARALTDLNRMLVERHLLRGFATLFVGAYAEAERTLTYVNAGQEPGLLWRSATGAVEELAPTGPVVGGFAGGVFSESVTLLEPGDALALFTDGLTEAGLDRRNLLDIDGVTRIFASAASDPDATPAEIIARAITGVEAAVTLAGIRDDVCLLVARPQ